MFVVVTISAVAVVASAAILIAGAMSGWLRALGTHPPKSGERFAVLADSAAARAFATETGDGRAAAGYLAAQPTAYWLTPEHDPIGAVGARVAGLATQARGQDATLPLVVYGIPDRDCGSYSAGGLSGADYPRWIEEIATSLRGAPDTRAVIVLEPDSLALADECGNLNARASQLRSAVAALERTDTWIYLDGGHSAWHSASDQARLLYTVGLDGVRGFSLNVSNFNAVDDEIRYAHDLSAALAAAGSPNAHALIDTSRSGVGSNGEWCNPTGRRVGEASGTLGDDVVDTNLWIKRPGESDGPCNGGPAAGTWWPQAAVELTRTALQ